MIRIKISADNERLIRGAKTMPELEGVRALILERMEQANAERTAAKLFPKAGAPGKLNWKQAKEVLEVTLGADLKAPPFPDPIWYQRVNRTLKTYGLDEAKLTELAEYVKDHLKPPYSMDFIICQHERVLSGEFDSTSPRRGASTGAAYVVPNWRKNVLPEE
jgi:hypothetical protein